MHGRNKILGILAIFGLCATSAFGLSGGGGSSFNAASPGAIGGTTSNTGQFTNVCVGPSPCTLSGTTGEITLGDNGASAVLLKLAPTGSNFNDRIMLELDNGGNNAAGINFNTQGDWLYDFSGGFTFTTASGTKSLLAIDHNANLTVGSAGSVKLTGGGIVSTTGGATPTVTCSGGATGTSVTAGSTNNRGSIVSSSSASTNCTITWSAAAAWPQAPFCQFTDGNASITPVAYSTGACGTSTCVVDFASATSKTIIYMCM